MSLAPLHLARGLCLTLALLSAAACSNNRGNALSFAFNRPEQLAFACLAAKVQLPGQPVPPDRYVPLPFGCCRRPDPANERLAGELPNRWQPPVVSEQECEMAGTQLLVPPVLHALVTQTTRGEVAAVDLQANDVLDSDRLVPGFTFLDSGGLPTAIVVPPWQPHGDRTKGPAFTYVASAEQWQLRAIPTCRYRSGSACGPDLEPENIADLSGYTERQRLLLLGAPTDLLLGPDEALWTTLPDLGAIARVTIPAPTDGRVFDPFGPPDYFSVPAPGALALPEPVLEAAEYLAACGLEQNVQRARLDVPNAPRASMAVAPRPERMRYDAESQLLFVSDADSPVLHVFRLDDQGALTTLGALPTGQPLREFVITPGVPPLALADLLAPTAPVEDPARDSKRYLYGIDALGTVAVFDLAVDVAGGVPTLTPLLVPAPGTRYADRIPIDGVAATLEVVDTRAQSDYACGQDSIDALRERRNAVAALPKPLTEAQQTELERLDARIAIYNSADAQHLRGVFVAIATLDGTLSMVDVHDLDLLCKAQKFCCAPGELGPNDVPMSCSLLAPRSPEAQNALAVRRHTLRRRTASRQAGEASTASVLQNLSCDGSVPQSAVQLSAHICGPADPWATVSELWRVDYQGTLPNSPTDGATFEPLPNIHESDARVALVAPAGYDFCARGLEVEDLVAVVGRAPEALRSECPDPSMDEPPTFIVREARSDRLIVEAAPADLALQTPVGLRDSILKCYPDFARIELRAGGYLVLGSGRHYLHRVITAPDGRCVIDESKDPLLNSRMRPGRVLLPSGEEASLTEVFRNPYVSFAMTPASTAPKETRETSVTVSEASQPLQLSIVAGNTSVPDALPSTLRYVPEVGYLFLLDSAGQGLRRYGLTPFQRDNEVFR